MFRRILVATDFSPRADDALRLATRLLDAGGRIRVVHVLPEIGSWSYFPEADRRVFDEALRVAVEDAEERLQRLAKAGERVEWRLRRGEVGHVLAAEADDLDADVVVVGATGMGRVQRAVLGSRARSALRHARRSVLVARGPVRERPQPAFRRIAVATDFYASSDTAGRTALRLAAENDAALLAIHAFDPSAWGSVLSAGAIPTHAEGSRWFEDRLRAMLHAYNERVLGGRATEALAKGRAARATVQRARRAGADLIVAGTHGAGAVERAMLGSVAEGLVEKASCSVLVVRE